MASVPMVIEPPPPLVRGGQSPAEPEKLVSPPDPTPPLASAAVSALDTDIERKEALKISIPTDGQLPIAPEAQISPVQKLDGKLESMSDDVDVSPRTERQLASASRPSLMTGPAGSTGSHSTQRPQPPRPSSRASGYFTGAPFSVGSTSPTSSSSVSTSTSPYYDSHHRSSPFMDSRDPFAANTGLTDRRRLSHGHPRAERQDSTSSSTASEPVHGKFADRHSQTQDLRDSTGAATRADHQRSIPVRPRLQTIESVGSISERRGDNEDEDEGNSTDGTGKRQARSMMTKRQTALLFALWNQTFFPDTKMRERLAQEAGLTHRQVQVWFQNQRQKQRRLLNPAHVEAAKAEGRTLPSPSSLAAGSQDPSPSNPRSQRPLDYRKDLSLDGRAMKANRSAPHEAKMRRLWTPGGKSSSHQGSDYTPSGHAQTQSQSQLQGQGQSMPQHRPQPYPQTYPMQNMSHRPTYLGAAERSDSSSSLRSDMSGLDIRTPAWSEGASASSASTSTSSRYSNPSMPYPGGPPYYGKQWSHRDAVQSAPVSPQKRHITNDMPYHGPYTEERPPRPDKYLRVDSASDHRFAGSSTGIRLPSIQELALPVAAADRSHSLPVPHMRPSSSNEHSPWSVSSDNQYARRQHANSNSQPMKLPGIDSFLPGPTRR